MIFLDLTKAYDALDRSRCLDILEGYGVGPGARRLLQNYWRRLTMVARSGGYPILPSHPSNSPPPHVFETSQTRRDESTKSAEFF